MRSMHHTVDGLTIIGGGLRTGLRGHTHPVVAKGSPPDIALQTGVGSVGSPRGIAAGAGLTIVIGGMAAHVWGHADVTLCSCLPLDEALQADIGGRTHRGDLLA